MILSPSDLTSTYNSIILLHFHWAFFSYFLHTQVKSYSLSLSTVAKSFNSLFITFYFILDKNSTFCLFFIDNWVCLVSLYLHDHYIKWTIVPPLYGTAFPWSSFSLGLLVNYFIALPVLKPPNLPWILHLTILLPFTLSKEKHYIYFFRKLLPSYLPK